MPPVLPPAKVLVTGASGYIALWVVRQLLHAGYNVRGTVRSVEKGEMVRTVIEEVEGQEVAACFEYVVVRDIAETGTFDEAVKDIDAITHTASPVNISLNDIADTQDNLELLVPAVGGTLNLLNSALKHGTNLKRIMITSSTAAVYEMFAPFRMWDESDWNHEAVRAIEENRRPAKMFHLYMASKVLSEQAAWKFVDEHRAKITWDLVTLCPSLVYGPSLANAASVEQLCDTVKLFYDVIIVGGKSDEFYATEGYAGFVHIRDVADALWTSRKLAESDEPYKWQDFLDAANACTPSIVGLSRGRPGAGATNPSGAHVLNNTRARDILGINFRGMSETTKDMLDYFIGKGWASTMT